MQKILREERSTKSSIKRKITQRIDPIVFRKSLEYRKANFKKVQNLETRGVISSIRRLKYPWAKIDLKTYCPTKDHNSSQTMKKIHSKFIKQYKTFHTADWEMVGL